MKKISLFVYVVRDALNRVSFLYDTVSNDGDDGNASRANDFFHDCEF